MSSVFFLEVDWSFHLFVTYGANCSPQYTIVVSYAHPMLISSLFVRDIVTNRNYIICHLPNKQTYWNDKGDDVMPDTVQRVYCGSELEFSTPTTVWRREHTRLNHGSELCRSAEPTVRTHFCGLLKLIQSISSSWLVSESSELLNLFRWSAILDMRRVLFITFSSINILSCKLIY